MFRVEKGVAVDQFILWFTEDMPYVVKLSLLISWMSRSCFTLLRTSSFEMMSILLKPRIIL